MQILKLRWKNFNSYGNKWNEIDLSTSDSGFYVITGSNGAGKCVSKNTEIDVEFASDELKKKFKKSIASSEYIK